MLVSAVSAPSISTIIYPEYDGQPLADNGRQFRWIVTLAGNLAALFRLRADVFVGGNQKWFPREGETELSVAPDVFVVFGRPKGERTSYKQWEEDNVPMTVVFEVLSPSTTGAEWLNELAFYDDYSVEEYYLYDPETNRLHGYVRRGEALIRVRKMADYVSPRLGIQFDLSGPELVVRYPDGRPFLTFEELEAEREQAQQRAEQAEQQLARVKELTRKALQQQANSEEMLELQRLLGMAPPSAP
jgi:Uma2 family endonuclease